MSYTVFFFEDSKVGRMSKSAAIAFRSSEDDTSDSGMHERRLVENPNIDSPISFEQPTANNMAEEEETIVKESVTNDTDPPSPFRKEEVSKRGVGAKVSKGLVSYDDISDDESRIAAMIDASEMDSYTKKSKSPSSVKKEKMEMTLPAHSNQEKLSNSSRKSPKHQADESSAKNSGRQRNDSSHSSGSSAKRLDDRESKESEKRRGEKINATLFKPEKEIENAQKLLKNRETRNSDNDFKKSAYHDEDTHRSSRHQDSSSKDEKSFRETAGKTSLPFTKEKEHRAER